jgi:acetolactate synthase-1/2/3 large subunit
VYQGEVLINASMPSIAAALASLEPVSHRPWGDWTRAARADFEQWRARREIPGPVQLWDVMDFLGRRLPEDAILTNGAGNYSAWVHRFYRYPRFRTQVAPTSGAMGYGVPAAVAAKIVHPDRMVVCFAGDGCFLMSGQELATAVQYQAAALFIVMNNGMFGTIRAHQERRFPGRVIGTDLVNPDFAAYARAFGAHGELVTRTEEFAPAFERAVASGKPALIEIRFDPQAITPNTTIEALRAQAQARR